MRKGLLVGWLIVVSVVSSLAWPGEQEGASPEEQFHTLEVGWMDALASKDLPALEATLAPGFTIIGAGSTISDATSSRQQWLDLALKRPFPKHTVKILKVTRSGETAVVQCILTGDYPPMPWTPTGGTLQFLITDTWIQREGKWQVLARHSSLPPAPADGKTLR